MCRTSKNKTISVKLIYHLSKQLSVWAYNFITNNIIRSLNIIFVDKKYDLIILPYYISDLPLHDDLFQVKSNI